MVFRGVPSEMADTLNRVNQPFAIWSETHNALLAARDFLGVAPLFYTRSGNGDNGWTVGTSVGQILDQAPETRTRLDEDSVVAHIAGPAAPEPTRTFYSRINAVTPGALMRFISGAIDVTRYWDPAEVATRKGLDLETAARELRELLIEVVADQLTARRVAICLDSNPGSALVLGALLEAGAEVTAIAWKPPDTALTAKYPWSQALVRKLGLVLTEVPMEAGELLPDTGVVTRRSTPYFDRFDHMRRVTASIAADHECEVLYTGFGEDRVFGGSLPSAADLLMTLRFGQLSEHLSASKQGEANGGLMDSLLAPIANHLTPGLGMRRQKPVEWLNGGRQEAWQRRQRAMIGPGLLPGHALRVSRLTDGTIPLRSEDLTALARPHGIEMYHPLLDRRIVEFALSLPSWLLHDGQTDRLVLRQATVGLLPKETAYVEAVDYEGIARRALRARADQLLKLARNMRAADLGYVDETALFEWVAAFVREEHDDMSFWNTLTLEDWLRRWW